MLLCDQQPKVTAILGPTNTGKTHYAIDRMLGYQSGMIGFPLRLLARENYERVVSVKGQSAVALVTGEEKILPTNPRYYICTVESMPLDRVVEFMAIDEIQMSGDPERGHIFTDRLLHARGSEETMFLGANTIRAIIAKLIPGTNFISRPRLSKLSYVGPKKITRLPRKTAVVAFSINEVYAIAELMRRQRGGTAVVLGALSPRTRNAQVEMYQKGEVDYLVATDAIGMGLNMNIVHIAFSRLQKFDGKKHRQLANTEIAQIAGRAGRNLSDGTFGPITEHSGFDEQIIAAVEQHEFDPLRGIYWRNENLDFRTGMHLQKSLSRGSNNNILLKGHIAGDKFALDQLLGINKIANYASSQDAVKLLWEVCQIPDFRKMMTDVHTHLLARIFKELIHFGTLPLDWVANQVSQLERVDGNIDSLMARIAHVRTWTYISHRGDWLNDSEAWQVRTRLLEDKLSDALHNALTQRFVDRRAATLSRIKGDKQVSTIVEKDGDVFVDGEFIGRLEGFRFIPDLESGLESGRTLVAAANKALRVEIEARVSALCGADNNSFSIDMSGQINWGKAKVARLDKGQHITSPSVLLLVNKYLTAKQTARIRARISTWVCSQMEFVLGDLFSLREANLYGLARGLAYRLIESLGSLCRWVILDELAELSKKERASLRYAGIRFGPETLFIPSLIKPRAVMWRSLLWRVYTGRKVALPPKPGLVTVSVSSDLPEEYLEACGYTQIGGRVVRVDVLNRLATDLQKQSRAGRLKIGNAHLNLLGLSMINARPIFEDLGYTMEEQEEKHLWKYSGREKNSIRSRRAGLKEKGRNRKSSKLSRKDSGSPFSKLRELNLP